MTEPNEHEPVGPPTDNARSNTHPQVMLAVAGVVLATALGGLAVLATRQPPSQSGPTPPAPAPGLQTVSTLTSALRPPAAATSLTPASTTSISTSTSDRTPKRHPTPPTKEPSVAPAPPPVQPPPSTQPPTVAPTTTTTTTTTTTSPTPPPKTTTAESSSQSSNR